MNMPVEYTDPLAVPSLSMPSSDTKESQISAQPKKHFSLKLIIFLIIALLILGGLGGGIFYAPKYLSAKFDNDLKPKVTSLKDSVLKVKDSINKLYVLATSEIVPTKGDSLKSAGLLIHPNLEALLINTNNVLGASNTNSPALIEGKVLDWAKNLKDLNNLLTDKNAQVLADQTNILDTTLRGIKDLTLKANGDISSAKNSLTDLKSSLEKPPILTTSNTKDKIINNKGLDNSVSPYLDEADKISNYYSLISDTLLTMNTKIQSFKTSMSLASSSLKDVTKDQKTVVAQAQVYLDQAKKDVDETKKLADSLSAFPDSKLPKSSKDFHQHNVKVLNAVTVYFDAESKAMQGIFDTFKSFSASHQTNPPNTLDLLQYRSALAGFVDQSNLQEAKFSSDIIALAGEEKSLAASFWQNNAILTKGNSAESELKNLENSLNSP